MSEWLASQGLIDLVTSQSWIHSPVYFFELKETHVSWVLLVNDFVFKVKKPVHYDFIDARTRASRRHFCLEEVRLNQRLASSLQSELITLPLRFQISGKLDELLLPEYAVRMRRFDESQTFESLIKDHLLEERSIVQLAGLLANFHLFNPVSSLATPYGNADKIQHMTLNIIDHISENPHCAEYDCSIIRDYLIHFFRLHQQDFERRLENGFIRECHGDLHLGNLVHFENQVLAFDALEFDPQLRWIDVMADLAFVIADLEKYHRPDFVYLLLDEYLSKTGDYEGLCLMSYYVIQRCLIRIKINLTQAGIHQLDIAEYWSVIKRYVASASGALIITTGLPGSGKSWVSLLVLKQVGAIRLRSDRERKRLALVHEPVNCHSSDFDALTYDRLYCLSERLLACGYTLIVDACFLKASERQKFRSLAGQYALPFLILLIQCDLNTLNQRIENRLIVCNDDSDAEPGLPEVLLTQADCIDVEESLDLVMLDTSEFCTADAEKLQVFINTIQQRIR